MVNANVYNGYSIFFSKKVISQYAYYNIEILELFLT